MSLYITNYGEVPNGGWRYTDVDTKTKITAASWKELLTAAKVHRRANNLPIGLMFDDQVEQQLAALLPASQVTNVNPNRSAEVPRSEWPMWAKMMAALAKPEDAGVGTTIERVIGPFGGDAFKVWFAATFGKSCGCSERRDAFDAQYPYKPATDAENP